MGCKCRRGKEVTQVRCWGALEWLLIWVWMIHACFLHLGRRRAFKWVG